MQSGFTIVQGWISKEGIGNNVVFFSLGLDANKIIAYDLENNRYVEVNPLTSSGYLEAEEKRVCFTVNHDKIYCHIYNSTSPYPEGEINFGDKVIGGYDFFSNDENPMDEHGHGTHVAATAAGKGVLKGVAPDAKIVAYKVFGTGSTTDDVIISAIDRSVDPNQDGDLSDYLDVISLSLGKRCWIFGYPPDCGPDDNPSKAIDRAVDAGVVAVISFSETGNPGDVTKINFLPKTLVTAQETDKSVLKSAIGATFAISGASTAPLQQGTITPTGQPTYSP